MKPGERVQLNAQVIKLRGVVIDVQMEDGQLVRTPARFVYAQSATTIEAQAVTAPTENKKVTGPRGK